MDFKEDLSHGYAGKKQEGIVWGREGQREGERAVAAPGATAEPLSVLQDGQNWCLGTEDTRAPVEAPR